MYALTLGKLSETATIDPIGPLPLIWALILSVSFFKSLPNNTVAVNSLPSAAVVVGVRSWIFLASSTICVDSITVIATFPSYAKYFFNILPTDISSFLNLMLLVLYLLFTFLSIYSS